MKLTLIILTTFFTLTFASPSTIIQPSSIIDTLSQLLYIHLNPILQNTLQQLTQLVFDLAEKLSQNLASRSIRSNTIKPALWVSDFFGGVNAISSQWNNQVTNFFTNIPTIFESTGRSLYNFVTIQETLYSAVANLLDVLQKFFVNNINQLIISIINKYNLFELMGHEKLEFDELLNTFQQQVSGVFDITKNQLNHKVEDSINFISTFWNDLKDRFIG